MWLLSAKPVTGGMESDRRLPRHRRPDPPPDGGLAHVGVAMLRGASNIPHSTNLRIFALTSQALG